MDSSKIEKKDSSISVKNTYRDMESVLNAYLDDAHKMKALTIAYVHENV